MEDQAGIEQFLGDDDLRGTDAFVGETYGVEIDRLRNSQRELFARIAEESAGYLPQDSQRMAPVDDVGAAGEFVPSSRTAIPIRRVVDRGFRWWGLTGVAAAAMLVFSLSVIFSIYSGNGVTTNGNNHLADSSATGNGTDQTPVTAPDLLTSDFDNAFALSFNAAERDLDRMQSDFDALPEYEDTTYQAASLDDAMNRFALDMESF